MSARVRSFVENENLSENVAVNYSKFTFFHFHIQLYTYFVCVHMVASSSSSLTLPPFARTRWNQIYAEKLDDVVGSKKFPLIPSIVFVIVQLQSTHYKFLFSLRFELGRMAMMIVSLFLVVVDDGNDGGIKSIA